MLKFVGCGIFFVKSGVIDIVEYILDGKDNSIIISDIKIFHEDSEFPVNTLCRVSVHSGMFKGEVEFDLDIKCLVEFSKKLIMMYETLEGEALLKETYGFSYIKIISSGNGHFNITGNLFLSYPRNLLEFEFDIDQTMLKDFAYSLYNDFMKY